MGRTRRRDKRSGEKRRRNRKTTEGEKQGRKPPIQERLQTLHFSQDAAPQHNIFRTTRTDADFTKRTTVVDPTTMQESSDPDEYNCCGCIPADQGIFALSLLIFMLSTVLIFFFAEVSNILNGVHYLLLILLIGLMFIFSGLVILATCVNRSRLFLPILIVGLISDVYSFVMLLIVVYIAFLATDETFADWFKEKGKDSTKLVQNAMNVVVADNKADPNNNNNLAARDIEGERQMLRYSCGVQLLIFLAEAYLMHAVHTAYKYIKKRETLRRRPSITERTFEY